MLRLRPGKRLGRQADEMAVMTYRGLLVRREEESRSFAFLRDLEEAGRVGALQLVGDIVPGEDAFWVVDLSIGYRLPKRFGLITLVGKNVFDEKFRFQDTDPGNPRIFSERLMLLKFNLFF